MKDSFLYRNWQSCILSLLALLVSSRQTLAQSAQTSPVNVSNPTTTVGTGTPASCTEAAFTDAIKQGGIITFNCGSAPYTLVLSSEKRISSDTVIDGGGRVTLSGGNSTGILSIQSYYDQAKPSLIVQNLNFANGYTTNRGGAAIYRLGGILSVINCRFTNNVGPATSQDDAGGAIYSVGGSQTTISGSLFQGNRASNGGAIGSLGSALTIANTEISNNTATGNGGNPGNGGNGGGVYIDGENTYFGVDVNLSGVKIINNKGNAYGGGMIRIAYNGEKTMIDGSSFEGNSIPKQSTSLAGGLYLQGTNITMKNSTVSKNSANVAGGMFVGPGSELHITNVNITQNTAYTVGGGLSIAKGVSGNASNLTVTNNQAPTNPDLANDSSSFP